MNRFMQVAFEEALLAKKQGEVPVGAALFKNKKLVAADHNRIEQTGDPTAHAELLVLKSAVKKLETKNLTGCELYVTLEPCAMCIGAAHLCKLDKLYFGAYDIKSGACGGCVDLPISGCFDYKTQVYGSIDEPMCEAILKDFFKKMREGIGNDNKYGQL